MPAVAPQAQAAAPKKAAPAPTPKAAPAPTKPTARETDAQRLAEIPREYLVFFDWDRADITTEAAQIIRGGGGECEGHRRRSA